MYLNRFSVKINGKKEESGYVEMKHGESYTIVLKNDNSEKCDALVEIDGKDIGTFRVNPHSNMYLERPANEAKKFTFYQLGTEEADVSGLNKVEKNEMGLIKVTFKPAIKKYRENIYTVKYSDTWDSSTYNANPTWTMMTTSASYSNPNLKTKTRNLYRCSVDSSTLPNAGGTGLSGHSDQEFITVQDLEYDEERITTIHLRLIPEKEIRKDPSELKPVVKSTPIPPPMFTII